MRRTPLTRFGQLAAVTALCALPLLLLKPAFAAGKQDFTLHNETGKTIKELYVSPHQSDDWEEDVLGDDELPTGAAVDINFDRKEQPDTWDMKVVFKDGKSSVWSKFNLSEITDITLYFKDGKPMARTKNGG